VPRFPQVAPFGDLAQTLSFTRHQFVVSRHSKVSSLRAKNAGEGGI